MLLGLTLANFTILHVVISLIGIVAGIIFFGALMGGRWIGFFHGLFIDFTVLTSVTGFMFPPKPIGPRSSSAWSRLCCSSSRWSPSTGVQAQWHVAAVHLGTALIAQWLNMVVLVVQSFQKVPDAACARTDRGGARRARRTGAGAAHRGLLRLEDDRQAGASACDGGLKPLESSPGPP